LLPYGYKDGEMKEIHNRLGALTLGLWLGLAASLCFNSGLSDGWESNLLELLPSPPLENSELPQVVKLSISEAPSEQATRLDYALFFRTLKNQPPDLLLADLPLHEEDVLSTAYDSQLFEQLRGYNRILFGLPLIGAPDANAAPLELPQPIVKGSVTQLPHYGHALLPQAMFLTLGNLAVTNLPSPMEANRIPLLFNCNGAILPSFALAGLMAHLGADWSQTEITPGRAIIIRNPSRQTLAAIPIDRAGNIWLRVLKGRRPAPVELADVILASEQELNGENPVIDLAPLRGKILMVGKSARGENSGGISAQAAILGALLQKKYLIRAQDQAVAGLLLVLCILAGQGAVAQPRYACFTLGGLSVTTIAAWIWLAQDRQVAFPGGLATLSLALSWCGGFLLFNPLFKGAHKEPSHQTV
jgi:hypothetical protein